VTIVPSNDSKRVQTKGDNNIVFDSEECTCERYFGIVSSVERGEGMNPISTSGIELSSVSIALISRWQGTVFEMTYGKVKLPGVCLLLRLIGRVLHELRRVRVMALSRKKRNI
jgi:hypothetical protein